MGLAPCYLVLDGLFHCKNRLGLRLRWKEVGWRQGTRQIGRVVIIRGQDLHMELNMQGKVGMYLNI
jgi:hypothetical protein